ncbi:vWA domain-containing protein [Halobaculum rubrum]|uniref:vWA domain-containing protein n=1 Tax=Halobaculum rubrum TaxID=2872158 RepID=UPI001CA46D0B|nr:VWA domain-containing protein [Halobaculum rubrum]QZY01152.1 VWA domain-containing protein [Halobaculum rubrum]
MFLHPEREHVRYDLKTGESYRLSDARVCQIADCEEFGECPACGEPLREWHAIDDYPPVRAVLDEFDTGETVYVVDAESRVTTADEDDDPDGDQLVDDWRPWQTTPEPAAYVCTDCGREADPRYHGGDAGEGGELLNMSAPADPSAPVASTNKSMGLATGGATDAGNFRENVREGHVPQPDALTYEGLVHDYRFPARGDTDAEGLFVPTCTQSVSSNPLTGEVERYLSIGLDSSLSTEEFERPALDLVAVLDVSGSMSSAFDEYYYDRSGTRRRADTDDSTVDTKLEAATKSLCALTTQLDDDDRLGVVLYDNTAHAAKPLRLVGDTDMAAIRRHIRAITAHGGTDMNAGFEVARDLFDAADHGQADEAGRERRVVFMTDAMPNTGTTSTSGLVDGVDDAATDGVFTTFVGMGLDANADLIAELSAVRGANHCFVHSATEFERRLGEEFDCLVTPLAFDLSVDVDADGYEVAGVYGSPSARPDDGTALEVTTLFPSPTEDGESRGGVILVELEASDPDRDAAADAGEITLTASWVERDGTSDETTVTVTPRVAGHDDDAVCKAVALRRYSAELREWAKRVREGDNGDESGPIDDWRDLERARHNHHERGSVRLRVSDADAQRFERLREYLQAVRTVVDDPDLDQELEVVSELLDHGRADQEVPR